MNGATALLDLDACRTRQARLRGVMAERAIDAVVVVTPEHIQYLTGHRWDHRFAPAAAVLATGEALLVCPDKPVEHAAVTEVRTYEAKWKSGTTSVRRRAPSSATGSPPVAGSVGWAWSSPPARRTSRAGSSRRR
jgi:Xaa-Pro aminopeptidase